MRPWAWIVCVFDGPMPSLSVGTVTTLWPHICMKQTQNVISSNSSQYLHCWLQLTHTCFIQNIIMFCIKGSLIEIRFLNILMVWCPPQMPRHQTSSRIWRSISGSFKHPAGPNTTNVGCQKEEDLEWWPWFPDLTNPRHVLLTSCALCVIYSRYLDYKIW